jgi:hypothetical protein
VSGVEDGWISWILQLGYGKGKGEGGILSKGADAHMSLPRVLPGLLHTD